jgi:PncC family amidohydrolase
MPTPDQDIVRVLARKVITLLDISHTTLAVAESSTGGLIGHLLTEVEGSSAVFIGGVIAYHNRLKEQLGVSAEILDKEGAVSAECAKAMAMGVREQVGADIGLAVTGIAGPDGGTVAKPVGLTHLALADSHGVVSEEHRLSGDRRRNKLRSAEMALRLVEKTVIASV